MFPVLGPLWLTLSEVCERLECSQTPVYRLVRQGAIRKRESWNYRRYSAADVQRILDQRKEANPHE